jgi:hypothetical protein
MGQVPACGAGTAYGTDPGAWGRPRRTGQTPLRGADPGAWQARVWGGPRRVGQTPACGTDPVCGAGSVWGRPHVEGGAGFSCSAFFVLGKDLADGTDFWLRVVLILREICA